MEEINNTVEFDWRPFKTTNSTFKSGLPISLKKKKYQFILPALTYASETWTLMSEASRKLKTTQRNKERCILRFTLRERKRNK